MYYNLFYYTDYKKGHNGETVRCAFFVSEGPLQKVIFTLLLTTFPILYSPNNVLSSPEKIPEQYLHFDQQKTSLIKDSAGFFDGVKFQITNAYPRLTHADHQIEKINNALDTHYKNWNSMTIFTIDAGIWKNLNDYFKADLLAVLSSGAIKDRGESYFNTPTKFRQGYDVLILTSNLYYYPLSYQKDSRLIDPFVGLGVSYTFVREETTVKINNKYVKDKMHSIYYDNGMGSRFLAGVDLNFQSHWSMSVIGIYSWNRVKGEAKVHATEGLRINGKRIDHDIHTNTDFQLGGNEKMDIDFGGPSISLILNYKF